MHIPHSPSQLWSIGSDAGLHEPTPAPPAPTGAVYEGGAAGYEGTGDVGTEEPLDDEHEHAEHPTQLNAKLLPAHDSRRSVMA
mmetsp:Transcript_23335/g.75973  ORF Transcript_23335/g.75973 Transcript_23335/m.75973 type:complete len:83 (-) Transcript_23335:725-973(-)